MAIIDPLKDDPNFPFVPLLQPGQGAGTLWIYNPASWQRREDVHHTVRRQTALPQGEAAPRTQGVEVCLATEILHIPTGTKDDSKKWQPKPLCRQIKQLQQQL